MFTSHPILDFFDYICTQNAQWWARIAKNDMERQRYNQLRKSVTFSNFAYYNMMQDVRRMI